MGTAPGRMGRASCPSSPLLAVPRVDLHGRRRGGGALDELRKRWRVQVQRLPILPPLPSEHTVAGRARLPRAVHRWSGAAIGTHASPIERHALAAGSFARGSRRGGAACTRSYDRRVVVMVIAVMGTAGRASERCSCRARAAPGRFR